VRSRKVTWGAWDASWIDKRLDNHVWNLMWAVWSPSFSGGRIDPKDFEEARRFAGSTHERRMAGLYVDFEDSATDGLHRLTIGRLLVSLQLRMTQRRTQVSVATSHSISATLTIPLYSRVDRSRSQIGKAIRRKPIEPGCTERACVAAVR
jgi:hypothetical protein